MKIITHPFLLNIYSFILSFLLFSISNLGQCSFDLILFALFLIALLTITLYICRKHKARRIIASTSLYLMLCIPFYSYLINDISKKNVIFIILLLVLTQSIDLFKTMEDFVKQNERFYKKIEDLLEKINIFKKMKIFNKKDIKKYTQKDKQ